jgi:hypothetical protein
MPVSPDAHSPDDVRGRRESTICRADLRSATGQEEPAAAPLLIRLSCLSATVERVFFGALVVRRILLYGLTAGAFALTLAFSSWHDAVWRSEAAPVPRAAPQPHQDSLVPTGGVASLPVAPTPEALATPTDAAAPAMQREPQSEPYSTPDVDNGEMRARRDRAAEHGSRSH